MNKMMLTPATGMARPTPADPPGPAAALRGDQDIEASAAFARLLQAKGRVLSAAPASQGARALSPQNSSQATPVPSGPPLAPPTPHAAAGMQSARPATPDTASEQSRRQEAAKANGRRSTEAHPKDRPSQARSGSQGKESGEALESQDPVLAQVMRHLRHGDSRAEADGDMDAAEEASNAQDEAGPDAGLPAGQVQAQPQALDPRQPLPPAASDAGGSDAISADLLARRSPGRASPGEGEGVGGAGQAKAGAAPGDALLSTAQAGLRSAQGEATSPEAAGLVLDAAGPSGKAAESAPFDKALSAGTFAGLLQQAQAGTASDKAAAPGAAGARYELHAPLHAPGFAPEMAARLSLAAADGVQLAQLHLNPSEMGPVQVQIVVDGQQAQISFVAEQADTRAVLEQSLPELAGALREQGLTLSGGGVFSQQQQTLSGQPGQSGHADRDGSTAGGRWASSGLPGTSTDDAASQPRATAVGGRSRGVLDLFA